MTQFKGQSIKVKIVLWVGICMLFTCGLIVAYAAVTQRKIALKTAEKAVLADGAAMANFIKAKLEVPLDSARTLARHSVRWESGIMRPKTGPRAARVSLGSRSTGCSGP